MFLYLRPANRYFTLAVVYIYMNWRKILFYTIFALGLLVAFQIALSVLATIIGLMWTIATSLATLAVIATMFYGGFKLVSWYRGGVATQSNTDATAADQSEPEPPTRVESLKERYANGHLSEAEFERELERELDGPDVDAIDRELSRERE
jgi:Predicted membrane protein (DUF2078).